MSTQSPQQQVGSIQWVRCQAANDKDPLSLTGQARRVLSSQNELTRCKGTQARFDGVLRARSTLDDLMSGVSYKYTCQTCGGSFEVPMGSGFLNQ